MKNKKQVSRVVKPTKAVRVSKVSKVAKKQVAQLTKEIKSINEFNKVFRTFAQITIKKDLEIQQSFKFVYKALELFADRLAKVEQTQNTIIKAIKR